MARRIVLLVLGLLCVAGGTSYAQKFYTPDIESIIEAHSCTNCHGGSGGLFVTPYANLMTTGTHAPVVVARDSTSYLVLKLKGLPGVGERMPFGGPYLTDAEIRTVVQWIMEGAKESAVVAGVEEARQAPAFALSQNYPNPFNPSTVIRYQVNESAPVKLVVYDMLGRALAVLVDEHQQPGPHTVLFDVKKAASPTGGSLATGTYVYQLSVGPLVQTKRMVLLQ